MTDGRNYATWQPGAVINQQIKQHANIKSNWQYRKYLTNNADSIIKYNQLEACDQCCSCPARYGNQKPISNSPFLYHSCDEKTQPYGYENSDLKNLYLDEYQLQCRLETPVITQSQLLQQQYPNYN
tara:strand:- start:786 stop:1163 length:378 start_codon:yes stop_codon:yes gene_type:complete